MGVPATAVARPGGPLDSPLGCVYNGRDTVPGVEALPPKWADIYGRAARPAARYRPAHRRALRAGVDAQGEQHARTDSESPQ